MKRLFLAAAAALSLAGCVDRGQCLASETVHHPESFYTTVVAVPMGANGQVMMIPQTQYVPATDAVVCVRWEFPEGRP